MYEPCFASIPFGLVYGYQGGVVIQDEPCMQRKVEDSTQPRSGEVWRSSPGSGLHSRHVPKVPKRGLHCSQLHFPLRCSHGSCAIAVCLSPTQHRHGTHTELPVVAYMSPRATYVCLVRTSISWMNILRRHGFSFSLRVKCSVSDCCLEFVC